MKTYISLILIGIAGITCFILGLSFGSNIAACPISIEKVEVPVKTACPQPNIAKLCVDLLNDAETVKMLVEAENTKKTKK